MSRTQALPHRTQILYLPDIAFITNYLDVKAGSKVIEAGARQVRSWKAGTQRELIAFWVSTCLSQEPARARSLIRSLAQSGVKARSTASSTTKSGSRRRSESPGFSQYPIMLGAKHTAASRPLSAAAQDRVCGTRIGGRHHGETPRCVQVGL